MSTLPVSTALHDGAYTLEAEIGRGGFGITYRARDHLNERAIAIKECFPRGCKRCENAVVGGDFWSHSHFEAFLERFRAQSKALQSLSHPNLVEVLDCFDENGTSYLVMELVEGQNLLSLLESNSVSDQQAAQWIEKLSGAIEVLHDAGWLHLDVKPENIIVREGEPVLLDFDLIQAPGGADCTTRPLALSMQCGTPGYAPLEQYAQSAALSCASDIYALGATFYHLLTGRAPLPAVDRAAGSDFLAPAEIRAEIAPHWNSAIMAALEIKATERPQNIALWLESLREPVLPPEEEEDYAPTLLAPQLMTHGTGIHRVVLSIKTPSFPKRCVCCHEKPDTTWMLVSPSGRYELPFCEACKRHQLAARASGMVTFWGTILSLALALLVVWLSFVTSSLLPLLLGPFCIVLNFMTLSYGALKSSRAEEMLKNGCCDLSEPATYNFNGKVHIFRFKNSQFATDFKKKNADFVV
ncbi:MAG TPA: serine/threonine-protein kinase [Abditibacterium sp.]|jgi:serine/threonine-protein kinase